MYSVIEHFLEHFESMTDMNYKHYIKLLYNAHKSIILQSMQATLINSAFITSWGHNLNDVWLANIMPYAWKFDFLFLMPSF